MKKSSLHFLIHSMTCLVLLLISCQFFPLLNAEAGCGCDKPPPAPGAVIPNAAFPGMKIRLFDPRFQPGDQWTVVFQNERGEAILSENVESRRDLTDPSGKTFTSQILLSLPQIPTGPTSIQVTRGQETFTVPPESFTVIGTPVMISRRDGKIALRTYTTAVGADGSLYLSVGGLASVCRPVKFKALLDRLPLRFTYGDIAILNAQGFFIESLDLSAVNHVAFDLVSSGDEESNHLKYRRHSFQQYCTDHKLGGPKEVDPQDPNWHLDGTPHVDYATLIMAINGHLSSGAPLRPGPLTTSLTMEHEVIDETETSSMETEEESVHELQ